MLELVAQILAYTGVGLVILVVGFFVLDLVTPGNLGKLVIEGDPNAALLSAATLASLGMVLWFAIFATDPGWQGLDETVVFGLVSVAAQAICFLVLDLITPGKLGEELMSGGSGPDARLHPGTWSRPPRRWRSLWSSPPRSSEPYAQKRRYTTTTRPRERVVRSRSRPAAT